MKIALGVYHQVVSLSTQQSMYFMMSLRYKLGNYRQQWCHILITSRQTNKYNLRVAYIVNSEIHNQMLQQATITESVLSRKKTAYGVGVV